VLIHLDPVGGVAGDMFVAALLDAWPELQGGLREALRAAQLPESVAIGVLSHKDHALSGTRFQVEDRAGTRHTHTPFRVIRERISGSALASGVAERALDIFALLAEAEASVHAMPVDEVEFHEVGAWDSIADIVGAAFLIDAVGSARWSTASLPLGSGRVKSAHGALPVPAPATALLLEGFAVHDDGLEGERVTPTGAAILRHLQPTYRPPGEPARIVRSGMGFGTREFPGISNVLRVLILEELTPGLGEEQIAVVRFEVDDQSPEDLAVGLDHLRELDGVVDVLQSPAFGKKGRLTSQVQVLADADALEPVIRACFTETTTLGVRWRAERRAVLERTTETYVGRQGSVRVKSATRPAGGVTGKAELDDVAEAPGGRAGRDRLRREAEQAILRGPEAEPDE
jgi:uncharacterized protein (TIGR00299 family) protein